LWTAIRDKQGSNAFVMPFATHLGNKTDAFSQALPIPIAT